MSWKRSLIIIVSTILLLPIDQLVHACADFDPDDDYATFFLNNIANGPAYRPFYYTGYYRYYQDNFDDGSLDYHLSYANIEEWQAYSDKSLPLADIDSFVYAYPYDELASLYTHIEKGAELKISEEMKENAFSKWFIKSKDLEALGYLMYAKQCEPHVQALDGHYDKETYDWIQNKRDIARMDRLRKNGLQLLAVAKNKNIRLRYVYQVVRLAFYSDNYSEALRLSEEYLPGLESESVMYGRALSLKAGAMFKLGRKDEAAYLYSKVFDSRHELKTSSYISFEWAVNGTMDGVLKLCKNDHERAVLYVMRGLHIYKAYEDKTLEWMQKAYSADPTIDGLDIVMTREINKEEGNNTIAGNDVPYLSELNKFSQKVANEGKNGTKAFWLLTSAYLYYMQNDVVACRSSLEQAGKQKMTDKEKEQYELIDCLRTLIAHGNITAQTEEEVLPKLQRIEGMTKGNPVYAKVFRDLMHSVIAPMYLAQKDTIKAVYAYDRSDKEQFGSYSSPEYFGDRAGEYIEPMSVDQLHKLQAFVSDKKRSKFEKWLTDGTPYSYDILRELEGTKYLRMQDFEQAISIMKDVPDSILKRTELPDAFLLHTDDWHEEEAGDFNERYNKLTFATAMLELEQKMKKDPKDAAAAFKYATGLYSMTYYGKADNVYTYYRGSTDEDAYYVTDARKAMPAYQQEFYSAATAEKYYMQAFENTTDKELKAKCLFMAAKCWQKNCPMPEKKEEYFWGSGSDVYYVNALGSPYLKQLAEGYKNTTYCKEAYNTCSYLRDYVSKH